MTIVGCRFCPTEEELVSYYLKKVNSGQQLMEEERRFFAMKDLYGDNATPWKLLSDDDFPWHVVMDSLNKTVKSQKILYVFTVLSNVGKKGSKNKNRVAGCGSWHANASAKPVMDRNGRKIGESKDFTFKSSELTVGQWLMTEYSIDASANGIPQYVLCKIKRDDSKSSKDGKIVVSNKRKLASSDGAEGKGFTKKHKSSNELPCEEAVSVIIDDEEMMASKEINSGVGFGFDDALPPLINLEDCDNVGFDGTSTCRNIPFDEDYFNSTFSFDPTHIDPSVIDSWVLDTFLEKEMAC